MPTRAVLRRHAAALLLLLPPRTATADRCISLTTRNPGSAWPVSRRNTTSTGVDKFPRDDSPSSAAVLPPLSSPPKAQVSSPHPVPKRRLATVPYTWDDLVDIIHIKNDLSLLMRSADQERVYQLYRDGLNGRWRSIYDHILHSKFRFERRGYVVNDDDDDGEGGVNTTDSSSSSSTSVSDSDLSDDDDPIIYDDDDGDAPPPGVLWEAHPPLSQFTGTRLTLCPNDFPYYMGPNIEHWCLWKIGGDVTAEEIEAAKDELRRRIKDEKGRDDVVDVLHWVNPPHLKSVPDIDHAHILCLRRGAGGGSAVGADECGLGER